MNKITKIFMDLSNEDLKKAINEIIEDNQLGIIRDGFVKKIAKDIDEINRQSVSTNLFFSEVGLLREAAFRWAGKK
jgi:vacuolar-type H+-ATPase subunit F/Vma7